MSDGRGDNTKRPLIDTVVLTLTVSLVALCGCVDDQSDETTMASSTVAAVAPSSTSTTVPPSTSTTATTVVEGATPTPTTTTTTTTTTLPLPVPPDGVELLRAHDDGIDLIGGAETIPLLEGMVVAMAFADGKGGVIYQRPVQHANWDPAGGRYTPLWPDGVEPTPIEWIPAPGEAPEILIPGDRSGETELVDVTVLGNRRVVVYVQAMPLDDPCAWYRAKRDPALEEGGCMWVTMHSLLGLLTARDLETDEEWPLGIVFGFDAGASVSVGGGIAAVTPPSLDPPLEVRIVDVDRLTAIDELDWPSAACDGRCRTIKPEIRCGPNPEGGWVPTAEIVDVALTPDGSRLAVVESHPHCDDDGGGNELVIIDVDSGGEVLRIVSPGWEWPWIVDFDGDAIVIDDQLVDTDPRDIITLPPANHYSIWPTSGEP